MPLFRLPWLSDRPAWLDQAGTSMARLVRPLLATSLLITGATLGLRYLGWLEYAELAAYDHLMQQQPDRGGDDRILVVGITDYDLQTLQEWPVSDRSLAQAIANLQALQPTVIGIDIFRDFPNEPGHAELMQQLQQHPNTLMICKTSSVDDLGTPPPPQLSADQVGFADLVIDPGGILRRSLLLVTPPQPPTPFPKQHLCNDYNQTLLSMGLRAALVYLQNRGMQPSFSEAGQLMLGSTAIPPINPNTGGYRRADTSGYQVMLRFRSETNAATQVSLMEVLEGRVDPELVRDRIVFLGYTTPQAKDDFYTPYSAAQADKQKMPGVIVHAQAASQLLATVLEGESLIWVWPHSAEWLWILAWSLGGGLLGWYFRHPAAFGLVIVLGAGGLYAISLSVFLRSGWIPLVPPALTFLGTAVGVVLLDRFNNSAYGQQVYRTVKTFLHLDIDIDEEKLEKQVAEITETDYFRDLQDTVKTLRESGDDPKAAPSRFNQAAPAWPGDLATTTTTDGEADAELEAIHRLLTPESPPPPRRDAPRPTAPEDSDDGLGFLGDLNQQAQQLKQQLHAEADDGLGFLGDLNQQAQQLKQQLQTEAPASPYQPFVLDSAFCRCQDTSEATEAYVQFIDREIQALKQGIRGKSAQHG